MSTTVLIIIFVVALVVSLSFLLLAITLVPAIQQFKALMIDLEKTSMEARDLVRETKRILSVAEDRLEKVDSVLARSKRTVEHVSDTLSFINHRVLRRSAGLLAFLPAVKMGWNLVKKFKGGK